MKKPTPFGKYFLLERINVGGMAEVFRAKAFGVEGFERLVAVKRILPNIAEDKEFIRMFIDEAKLSVQLNHANVAQIFDLGVVDGAYYIALEHVHGRDLRGIFDRCRQVAEAMPVAQACFVVMKVCEGLDYAHNKRDQGGRELQLVHRDVSPQNVLVSFEGEVKIIDFGIAKAAGKGSKTQAGILKGKFGYMSPEQVRGLPVDRRSDVFSAGIVLYELLTGERLFVGESDFSTLEKVRNVEILPPSTYNRKIPDELERIVLKALAKDVEDRYQNAIDLHDELQAFVYTAGEFYSRKDLAGWMKKTFSKEIEEETAKLESYRQLKPPPAEAPAVARAATGSKPPHSQNTPVPSRRSTQGMPTTKPPPPPRVTGQMPAVSAASSSGGHKAVKPRQEDSGDLAWDDDELETQIYDNPEDDPKNNPGAAPRKGTKQMPLAAGPVSAQQAAATEPGPDLSSLVSTSKGWEKGPPIAPIASPAATLNGIGGLGALGASNGAMASAAPQKLATGSNKVAAPLPPAPNQTNPLAQTVDAGGFAALLDQPASHGSVHSGPRESAVSQRLVSVPDTMFDPMASFGSGITARKDNKKGLVLIAVGGALVAAIAVILIITMTGNKTTTASAPVAVVGDQNTGFDLYVLPVGAGVTQWKLDGEARADRLPSRIRGIAPGTHRVQIEGPNGFLSHDQQVNVELGKAGKVEIGLQAMQVTGEFETDPAGATVSLIVDGKRQTLGPSPATAPLDPRSTYQVLFEKPGFVSVNRPVVFDSSGRAKVAIKLE
ncbi:MAG: serine/threonine protein kinase, partial [Deltaproteobacteria bacterium]|nr:serine/threonine protein kinase [Deltaproteobacteria bacterium]